MVAPFSPEELKIARSIAGRLAGAKEPSRFLDEKSEANEAFERFLNDPSASRLQIDGGGLSLEVGRTEFFSAWQQEICNHSPELIQKDTISDAQYLEYDLAKTISNGVKWANLSQAREVALSLISKSTAPQHPRTILPILEQPFRVLYARTANFMRNCHLEPSLNAFALMVEGEGYFSYPVEGKWRTHSCSRGALCTEPSGGIHAGQCGTADLLALASPTSCPREMRMGVVTSTTLVQHWNRRINAIHEDQTDSAHCYLLVLDGTDSIPHLPVGTYFVFESEGHCWLDGEGLGNTKEIVLKKNDIVAWTGMPSASLRLNVSHGRTMILAATTAHLLP